MNSTNCFLLCISALLLSCSLNNDGAAVDETGQLTTCYRGQRIPAVISEGELVVMGDILVGDSDQWCAFEEPIPGKKLQASRIQSNSYQSRWPGGVVPFDFGKGESINKFTDAQKTQIRAMMAEIESLVPGVSFRDAVSGDANVLVFRPKSGGEGQCSLGRFVNEPTQDCKLGVDAVDKYPNSYTGPHEISHGLGVTHQHVRNDRDDYVVINWHNIQGCPDSATTVDDCGSSFCSVNGDDCGCSQSEMDKGTCWKYIEFTQDGPQADIGPYSFKSIMHYGRTGGSKSSQATIGFAEGYGPAEFGIDPFGSADGFSETDILTLRAMYPTIEFSKFVFVTRGVSAPICSLKGREDDAATKFRTNPTASHEFDGNRATVSGPFGFETVPVFCEAASDFWSGTYSYPNATQSHYGSGAEKYSGQGNVRIANAGLIPVLF